MDIFGSPVAGRSPWIADMSLRGAGGLRVSLESVAFPWFAYPPDHPIGVALTACRCTKRANRYLRCRADGTLDANGINDEETMFTVSRDVSVRRTAAAFPYRDGCTRLPLRLHPPAVPAASACRPGSIRLASRVGL